MSKSILITGGNGLIGRALINELIAQGFRVGVLSRGPSDKTNAVPVYHWDINRDFLDAAALEDVQGIVHLAGAGIGDRRWSAKRKQEIIDSRVKSLQLLHKTLLSAGHKVEVLVSGSAVGWYGAQTSEIPQTEDMPAADDFLGQTCKHWEAAADGFRDVCGRIVKIRTGVVLSKAGGALAKMALPVRLGLGSAPGSGKQVVPWIHERDIVGIFRKALTDNAMQGAFNAVAPVTDTMDNFLRQLAKTLKRPYFFPRIPAIAIKILFGEMAGLFLEGSPVAAHKILSAGYQFRFPELAAALNDLCIT